MKLIWGLLLLVMTVADVNAQTQKSTRNAGAKHKPAKHKSTSGIQVPA